MVATSAPRHRVEGHRIERLPYWVSRILRARGGRRRGRPLSGRRGRLLRFGLRCPAWRAPLHPKQHPNQTVQREPAGSGPRPSPFHCGVAAIWSPIEPPSRGATRTESPGQKPSLYPSWTVRKNWRNAWRQRRGRRGDREDSSPQGGRPLWAAKKPLNFLHAVSTDHRPRALLSLAKQYVRGDGACIGQSPQFRRRDRPQLLPLCLIEPLTPIVLASAIKREERLDAPHCTKQPICRCAGCHC